MKHVPLAVAFDAFGTLCTLRTRRASLHRLARTLGISTEHLRTNALTSRGPLVDYLAYRHSEALRAIDDFQRDLDAELSSFTLYSDTIPCLDALRTRGVPVAVVSNLASPYATVLRGALGSHVNHWVLSCEIGITKPSQQLFSLACQLLDAPPERVLLIGDSVRADIEPAVALKMPAVRIRRGDSKSAGSLELTSILRDAGLLPHEGSG